MKKFDAVIVLGSRPDISTWQFPEQVFVCLDKAREILIKNQTDSIIVSGKWSIALDNVGIQQPFNECDAMAEYLRDKGVAGSNILKEVDSKDTISNLYYIKTKLLIPKNMKKLLFVVADFRIPRLEYLCKKILGPEYEINFDPIISDVSSSYNEPNTFNIQKEFLDHMKDGDHGWLADKFYTAPMYKFKLIEDRKNYALRNTAH